MPIWNCYCYFNIEHDYQYCIHRHCTGGSRKERKTSLDRPTRRLEKNLNTNLRHIKCMVLMKFAWLTIRKNGGLLWNRQWTLGFHKMRGISWIANWLLLKVSALYSQLRKVQDFAELREAINEVVLKIVSVNNVEMCVTKRTLAKAQKVVYRYSNFAWIISTTHFSISPIHLRKTCYEQKKHGRQFL